jgi:hypothetical protein
LILQIYEKAYTVKHDTAVKIFEKCGISNGTEDDALYNEGESLSNGNTNDECNGDGDFTGFCDQWKLHTALPF